MQPHFLYGMVNLNIKDISNIQTPLPPKPHLTFSLCTRTPVSFWLSYTFPVLIYERIWFLQYPFFFIYC